MKIEFVICEKLIKKVCKDMCVDLDEGRELISSFYCEMDEEMMEEVLESMLNY